MMSKRFLALTGLILVAALSRFLPHPWNWTAIGAAALLGGARFDKMGEALIVPLAALALTDLAFGSHITMGYVYGAIALTAFVAHLFAEKITGWRVGVAAISASIGFYLVTNFGVWMSGGLYPATFTGLVDCYVAGLPFLTSQMMGDLFYAGILFGVWDLAFERSAVFAKSSTRL